MRCRTVLPSWKRWNIPAISFCGACATIYRIAGDRELKACLACSTRVENNMYVATLPFFPLVKEVYDMEKLKPTQTVMMQLYPEIYACVGCNACTKACTQGLNVMQYIAYAQRGEFDKCAEESFDCVMCGVCSSRCPAGISHPQVAMLARRLNGKYIAPHCEHLDARVQEVKNGKFEALIESLMEKPLDEIKELYGFPTAAIVSMSDVVECLYNKECQGKVVIDDTLKAAIDAYYEQYGAK